MERARDVVLFPVWIDRSTGEPGEVLTPIPALQNKEARWHVEQDHCRQFTNSVQPDVVYRKTRVLLNYGGMPSQRVLHLHKESREK